MDKCYRIGAVALLGAVLLRFGTSDLPQQLAQVLSRPEVAQTILLAESGRKPVSSEPVVHFIESAAPVFPVTPEPVRFTSQDAELIQLKNTSGKTVDVAALLQQQLDWDLYGTAPSVLILHTHATESYTGEYKQNAAYRTLDTDHNMLYYGQVLAAKLHEAGLSVIQDRTLHDYPSYNEAYSQARSSVSAYLEQYPSIKLVLDLHRDAVADTGGNQLAMTCAAQNQDAAQVMLVVGGNHDDWQENMALAVKLQAQLEKQYPGLCRPIALRNQRYNQDLSTGALLIELGAAGNTREQALLTVELLSQAVVDLCHGTA